MKLILVAILLLWSPWGQSSNSSAREPSALVSSRIEDRVIKVFDFDEEQYGNYEHMPMNWQQITSPQRPGHPRFLEPLIDKSVGHLAPPSFKLPLAGGSLACHYLAKEISVHPSCDYLITAWIRPHGLAHARAYVTAYFLDHALQEIDATRRPSARIGGDQEDAWQRVTLLLSGGHERARWIGLSVHVEQQADEPAGPTNLRPIRQQDIRATAWFDDISVVRMPSAYLGMSAIGSVFMHDEPVTCEACIVDLDGRGLDTRLEIIDAEGELIDCHRAPIVRSRRECALLELHSLAPGFYCARLVVEVSGHEDIAREVSFIRLAPSLPTVGDGFSGLGVSVGPSAPAHQKISDHLLTMLGATAVKVPLWRRDMDDEEIVEGDRRADVLIRALRSRGVTVVGVLGEPPPSLLQAFGHPGHTALDVLASPPERWKPYLAFPLARYGYEVQAWQVGPDVLSSASDVRQLAAAVENVRTTIEPLVGKPTLVAPQSVMELSPEPVPDVDVRLLDVSAQISSDRLSEQVAHLLKDRAATSWIGLETLSADRFDRRARLAETARRIVLSLQAGAQKVFVAQPWTIEDGDFARVEPDEVFCVVRTLFQALGGLEPAGEVWLDPSIRGYLFEDRSSGRGALVVWARGHGESPQAVRTDAVPDARHYDLFGNQQPISLSDDGRILMVESLPSVLVPVDAERVRTLADFHIDNSVVQVRLEPHRRVLKLRNGYRRTLAGRLEILPPDGWQVSPRRHDLHVPPGAWTEIPLILQMPANQAIGPLVLRARLRSAGQPASQLMLRASLSVSCPELDVNVLTRMEENGLHVVQRITNRSGRTLDLRSLVLYPDMRDESRVITGLVDGQTAVREYTLEDAETLLGRPIRVTVEEWSGSIKCHHLVTIPAVQPTHPVENRSADRLARGAKH